MTQATPYSTTPAPARKLSVAALISFIFGILGCIPFLGGLLALVFGVVGIVKTGNPARSGRWMAVVGMILGIISIGFWGIMFGGGLWLFGATKPLRTATHDFVQALSAGDIAKAKTLSSGYDDEELEGIKIAMQAFGTFKDTTFTSTNIVNSNGSVSGTVTFTGPGGEKSHPIAATLVNSSGWKVTDLRIVP